MDGNGLSPVWSPECPQVPGRGSRTGCNPSSYPACPHGWAGAAAAASCSPSHSAAERLLGSQGGSLHARKNRDWCLLHLLPVWALLTWLFAEWHKVRSRVVCPTTPLPKADAMFLPSQVDCGSRSSSSPGSSPAPSARSRKPGAVIESFVNHAPGVFSGTFSGTCCSIPGGALGESWEQWGCGSGGAACLTPTSFPTPSRHFAPQLPGQQRAAAAGHWHHPADPQRPPQRHETLPGHAPVPDTAPLPDAVLFLFLLLIASCLSRPRHQNYLRAAAGGRRPHPAPRRPVPKPDPDVQAQW